MFFPVDSSDVCESTLAYGIAEIILLAYFASVIICLVVKIKAGDTVGGRRGVGLRGNFRIVAGVRPESGENSDQADFNLVGHRPCQYRVLAPCCRVKRYCER